MTTVDARLMDACPRLRVAELAVANLRAGLSGEPLPNPIADTSQTRMQEVAHA